MKKQQDLTQIHNEANSQSIQNNSTQQKHVVSDKEGEGLKQWLSSDKRRCQNAWGHLPSHMLCDGQFYTFTCDCHDSHMLVNY